MSRIIVITVPPPPPPGFTSTMGENSVTGPEFDVSVVGAELSFAEQAATLRAAADELDRLNPEQVS